MNIDITQDEAALGATKDLGRVGELAQKAVELQARIAKGEELLKQLGAELRQVVENDLPQAMDEVGIREFKTHDGHSVTIKQVFAGSIPKATQEEAFQWLREHGHEGLIKRQVSVAFGRGEDGLAEEAIRELHRLGLQPDVKQSVHPQTLGAWAKELITSGHSIPTDLLGIFVGRKATIK